MPRSFDTIARIYAPLERVTFGSILQQARLDSLQYLETAPTHALLLGDGDGRYCVELHKRFPQCRIDSIDISPAMHAQAAAHLKAKFGKIPPQYRPIVADARNANFPQAHYDFIGLHFFLDCFNHTDCQNLIEKCTAVLTASGHLSFADFTVPKQGFGQYLGSALIWLLYINFAWTTGLEARSLPNFNWPDNLDCVHRKTRFCGVLENKLFRLAQDSSACRKGKASTHSGRRLSN
jgi:ubiquinone/menaquinone biosynthesis C-methylase UbiE